MAYNVENLFDTVDDPKKRDETYIPLSQKKSQSFKNGCKSISQKFYRQSCLTLDWNDKLLKEKLNRIAKVIRSVNNGQGPDILILEEIENIDVIEQLRKEFLGDLGYTKAILLEGPDRRGIDIGMLTKLPEDGRPQLHKLNLRPGGKLKARRIRPTRGILHSRFKLPGGDRLHVLGVHFPSQANPSEAREQGIELIEKIRKSISKQDYIIVGGDFNITRKEDKKRSLYKKKLAKNWLVSHIVGCEKCPGTHSYRKKFSFLDALLFSKNLEPGGQQSWVLDPKSIVVANFLDIQNTSAGRPARFENGRDRYGVSDHWPLFARIIKNPALK